MAGAANALSTFGIGGAANALSTLGIRGLTTAAAGLIVSGGIANLAGSITTGTANAAIFNASGLSTLAGATISGTTNVSTFNATSVATLSGNTSLSAYTEKMVSITASATTNDLDLKVASIFKVSIGAITANLRFINPPVSGTGVSATLIIQYTGIPTVTLQGNTAAAAAGTLKYAYDSAPTLTRVSGKTDILSAITFDGGTTYIVSPSFMNFTT
jgi:hypothetical protein